MLNNGNTKWASKIVVYMAQMCQYFNINIYWFEFYIKKWTWKPKFGCLRQKTWFGSKCVHNVYTYTFNINIWKERANNSKLHTKAIAHGTLNIKTLGFAILKLDTRDIKCVVMRCIYYEL